jgi:hypothetical protein
MSDADIPLYSLPSGAVTASFASAPIAVAVPISMLAVNINITAITGTTPTMNFFIEGLDDNGVWYTLWAPTQFTTTTGDTESEIGPGLPQNHVVPGVIRVRVALGGTSPSYTMSISVVGRGGI